VSAPGQLAVAKLPSLEKRLGSADYNASKVGVACVNVVVTVNEVGRSMPAAKCFPSMGEGSRSDNWFGVHSNAIWQE